MKKGEKFQELVKTFRKVEGTSIRQAEQLTYALLSMKKEERIELGTTIAKLTDYIHLCDKCNMWYENDKCPICDDSSRDQSLILVVNDYRLVDSFEKTGKYRGLYFVVHDMVSVNTTPDMRKRDLSKLADRVRILKIREVILGFDPTQFGEINALYVEECLRTSSAKISRLARGAASGNLLSSLDTYSLESSLENRQQERKK